MNTPHTPVLLDEVLDSFRDIRDGYFIDCTLGYAGHSIEILKRYKNIKHIGIDRDIEAINFSKNRLRDFKNRVTLYRGAFSSILLKLEERPISGLLADFGVSSLQLDKLERGFSFESDNLDMRMDSSSKLTAYEVVNNYSKDRLEYIFREYGEVRLYKKLTSAIIEARVKKFIRSAKELATLISKTIPRGKIHPATLPFQAIRIEVNSELKEIERLLDILEQLAKKGELSGAVVSLITFHSLEDRLVKNRYKKWAKRCICDSNAIRCSCGKNNELGKILNRKPIIASKEELKINPRSRSAKLRSFKFSEASHL